MKSLKIMSKYDRLCLRKAKFMFKIYNDEAPIDIYLKTHHCETIQITVLTLDLPMLVVLSHLSLRLNILSTARDTLDV